MTTAMATPTTTRFPIGNSGTAFEAKMVNVVWAGRPGPKDPARDQQVTTLYNPISVVAPAEGAPVGVGGIPPLHIARSVPTELGAVGNQAAVFGRAGPQPVTSTIPEVPESSKEPGPPKGIVQNAVPPPVPKAAVTGQPARNVHANVKPEGVMTAEKNTCNLSPVEVVNWF
jgi:hypothetical protein